MKIKLTLILAFLLIALMLAWFAWTEYGWGNCVAHNPNGVELASDRLEKAMLKMGPEYYYDLYPDGTLKVKLNGKWLRLRY